MVNLPIQYQVKPSAVYITQRDHTIQAAINHNGGIVSNILIVAYESEATTHMHGVSACMDERYIV